MSARSSFVIFTTFFLLMTQPSFAGQMWGGASSYFLHALQDDDRADDVLQATSDAGLKALRVFVIHV